MAKLKEMKVVFTIVNSGFGPEVVTIARENGAGGATTFNARGAGHSEWNFMGISVEPEKEVVICVVEPGVAIKIMSGVKEKLGLGTPANGICFSMTVERVTSSKVVAEQKPADPKAEEGSETKQESKEDLSKDSKAE